MTPQQELAYDLFSAAFSETNADARFVTLMMAFETLLPQTERSDAARTHVDRLIDQTSNSSLSRPERDSLTKSLEWLRYESISKSGRTLAKTLGSRTYMPDPETEDPVSFFQACYDMRSQLVHGLYPRPTREEVSARAPHLERFVGDLLAFELLDYDPTVEEDGAS